MAKQCGSMLTMENRSDYTWWSTHPSFMKKGPRFLDRLFEDFFQTPFKHITKTCFPNIPVLFHNGFPKVGVSLLLRQSKKNTKNTKKPTKNPIPLDPISLKIALLAKTNVITRLIGPNSRFARTTTLFVKNHSKSFIKYKKSCRPKKSKKRPSAETSETDLLCIQNNFWTLRIQPQRPSD